VKKNNKSLIRATTRKLFFLGALLLAVCSVAAAQKKVMLFDRFGPSQSVMYIANADGTNQHPLFAVQGTKGPALGDSDDAGGQ